MFLFITPKTGNSITHEAEHAIEVLVTTGDLHVSLDGVLAAIYPLHLIQNAGKATRRAMRRWWTGQMCVSIRGWSRGGVMRDWDWTEIVFVVVLVFIVIIVIIAVFSPKQPVPPCVRDSASMACRDARVTECLALERYTRAECIELAAGK